MNISKNISPEGEATLEIEIPIEETSSEFTEVLKKFQREVNVPGFRPGKVPMNLVKKRWGNDILAEKAEDLARKYLVDVLKQEELDPGGQIKIHFNGLRGDPGGNNLFWYSLLNCSS